MCHHLLDAYDGRSTVAGEKSKQQTREISVPEGQERTKRHMEHSRFVLTVMAPKDATGTVCDFLARESGLSKARVKTALAKGAIWIHTKSGLERFRRATREIRPGAKFEIFYDEALLALTPPLASLLSDRGPYSVWLKPAGLLAQGTQFGDHASLLRQAELHFEPRRQVFLVHRLDREVEGVMLVAHTKEAAARLSELFRTGSIEKRYRADVAGNLAENGTEGVIDTPLDGREAHTVYRVERYLAESGISTVTLSIRTGRFHQIRRHMEAIGHPIIGDPRYGANNKNTTGLRLWATSLRFKCPFENLDVEFARPDSGYD